MARGVSRETHPGWSHLCRAPHAGAHSAEGRGAAAGWALSCWPASPSPGKYELASRGQSVLPPPPFLQRGPSDGIGFAAGVSWSRAGLCRGRFRHPPWGTGFLPAGRSSESRRRDMFFKESICHLSSNNEVKMDCFSGTTEHFIGPLKPISLTVNSGPTGLVTAPGDRAFLSV